MSTSKLTLVGTGHHMCTWAVPLAGQRGSGSTELSDIGIACGEGGMFTGWWSDKGCQWWGAWWLGRCHSGWSSKDSEDRIKQKNCNKIYGTYSTRLIGDMQCSRSGYASDRTFTSQPSQLHCPLGPLNKTATTFDLWPVLNGSYTFSLEIIIIS